MIIEFIGPMAAGKTTLHRNTVQRLSAQGRTVLTPQMLGELCGSGRFGRPRRLWFRFRASWRSRALVLLAARHLLTSGRRWSDKLIGFRWFLTSLGNRWKAHLTLVGQEVALIDEGVSHRMFNVFVHDGGKIDLAAVRRYARVQPLPDVLIYLTLPPETAMLRALTRSKKMPPRFRSLNHRELNSMFVNAAQALDVLVHEIQTTASRPVKILVIPSEDLTTARRELSAHLDAILMSSPSLRSLDNQSLIGRDIVEDGSRPIGEGNRQIDHSVTTQPEMHDR